MRSGRVMKVVKGNKLNLVYALAMSIHNNIGEERRSWLEMNQADSHHIFSKLHQ